MFEILSQEFHVSIRGVAVFGMKLFFDCVKLINYLQQPKKTESNLITLGYSVVSKVVDNRYQYDTDTI
jgi:hypothetical protein